MVTSRQAEEAMQSRRPLHDQWIHVLGSMVYLFGQLEGCSYRVITASATEDISRTAGELPFKARTRLAQEILRSRLAAHAEPEDHPRGLAGGREVRGALGRSLRAHEQADQRDGRRASKLARAINNADPDRVLPLEDHRRAHRQSPQDQLQADARRRGAAVPRRRARPAVARCATCQAKVSSPGTVDHRRYGPKGRSPR